MKKYREPEVDVTKLPLEDIITTSGVGTGDDTETGEVDIGLDDDW